MTSDLSILAARVRDFIAVGAGEFSSDHQESAGFQNHADAEFNGLALMLATLQFNHNAAYRKICEARNIRPDSLTHWTQIPAVPTPAFKEWELTSLPPEARARVFHSSGTTEHKPSRHFHNAQSLALYEASLWPWFLEKVLAGSTTENSQIELLVLTPPPAQAANSSLVHMFEKIRQTLRAPAESFLGNFSADGLWALDFDAALAALTNAARSKTQNPKLILGTAFSFVHLLDFLAGKNLRLKLPPGSRVMETGGYKNRSRSLPKSKLHALITDRLGVPARQIVCEYGMSELSSQAYDSPVTRHFQFPPWARAQVVSPETGREVADGETGLLRIFDLANVFSVMAIQTQDLAIRRGGKFELLGRAPAAEPRGCSLMTAGPPV